MDEFNLAFGKKLKEVRESFGYTQEKLGKAAGLTGAWISHFECGRRSPRLKHFRDICRGFVKLNCSFKTAFITAELLRIDE